MKKNYKFGLIGCGRIGLRHAEILHSGAVVNAELVAICDKNLAKLDKFKTQFDVAGFASISQMLTQCELDFVVICTESGYHEENVIECAQFGIDIIVEKPMALTLSGAKKMIIECDKNNSELFVVKQNRFNLPIVIAKMALDQGKFGKLNLGTVRVRWSRNQTYYDQDTWRGTWSLDGGVFANQASHHIDILQYFMGEVKSVFAYGSTRLVDIEAEDTAVAILKFKSGALGIIEATTATRPKDLEGSLSLLGERGSVVIGGFALNKIKTWEFDESASSISEDLDQYSENPPDVYGFGHLKYYENLVNFKNGNSGQLVMGRDGLRTVEITSALYRSMETRSEILLPVESSHTLLGISRDETI